MQDFAAAVGEDWTSLPGFWVAVKDLSLSDYIGGTFLITI